jgi:hypothetical protein
MSKRLTDFAPNKQERANKMRNVQYRRKGRQISADEALDAHGCLRDGVSLRLAMTDGATVQHRPGFVQDSCTGRDAKQKAIDQYEHDLTNAWRHGNRPLHDDGNPPTGIGASRKFRGSREGDLCMVNGSPGRLVRAPDGTLRCKPDRDDEDTVASAAARYDHKPGHAQTMDAYRQYDQQIANEWRRGK